MTTRMWKEAGSRLQWYHWVGGAGAAVGLNGFLLAGMAKSYRWYFQEDDLQARKFAARFGIPSEKQRLETFAFLAPKYDATIGMYEKSSADLYRNELMVQASGEVLEVAIGTGQCFEALTTGGQVTRFVGIDALDIMLDLARQKIKALTFPVELKKADAHSLPFPDSSFDTVIGSLCLCSMERPNVVLDEMARVCRPGGKVLLVEPGLARRWPVRVCQQYLGLVPIPKHAWEFGWFDDLDPVALVNASALSIDSFWTKALGNWYLIIASPRELKS